MSKHLNDHSYEVAYAGSTEKKTVRMRTVQLGTPKNYGAVKVLSMMDNPSDSGHPPHEAKLTTVHFGSNSSTIYNIDEIREVLAEYDAWQEKAEDINVDHINASINKLVQAGYCLDPQTIPGQTYSKYTLMTLEEWRKKYSQV